MINNDAPLVSVLMTAYNREDYIGEAIESVLASTYKNFELIIVDDRSTDDTLAIAKTFEKDDRRIKVYLNETNLKDYPNRNKAASYAKGKYIKYLDSDDKIFDWGLAYCVEMMEKWPGAGMGFLYFEKNTDQEFLLSKEAINIHFFKKSLLFIGPSGAIYNRNSFMEVGGFNTAFGVASDMYFNIKSASLFPVVLLRKEFFFYRRHEGQEINSNSYSYLLNNYLYQKQIHTEDILPLEVIQKKKLEKKMKKGFAISLIKSFTKPANWKKTYQCSREAHFGIKDILLSILN